VICLIREDFEPGLCRLVLSEVSSSVCHILETFHRILRLHESKTTDLVRPDYITIVASISSSDLKQEIVEIVNQPC